MSEEIPLEVGKQYEFSVNVTQDLSSLRIQIGTFFVDLTKKQAFDLSIMLPHMVASMNDDLGI